MEPLEHLLSQSVNDFLSAKYNLSSVALEFQATRKDFEGDITLVLFPLLKHTRENPVVLGNKIGSFLEEHTSMVLKSNVVSGFLNLSISDDYYLNFLQGFLAVED